jgi:hypothetical protein
VKVTAMKVTAETITTEQLRALMRYAQDIGDTRLASQVTRALDNDSLYNLQLREICAAAYAGAHRSSDFKRAARAVRKVTAETITDEQIHASGASAEDIERALQKTDRYWTRSKRAFRKYARTRCANAWNVRHGDAP